MALAQQTDVLLLDEPTTFLDVSHQIEVLDLLTDLNRSRGTTIVMVLHDLNVAARYADHLIAMVDGRVHAAGSPRRRAHRRHRAGRVRARQPDHRRPHLGQAIDAPDRPPPRARRRCSAHERHQRARLDVARARGSRRSPS